MSRPRSWTDERRAILTRLWNEGYTASQIANQFGDVTRNAVIGQVHRLGLSGRAAASRFRAARIAMRPRCHGKASRAPVSLKADVTPKHPPGSVWARGTSAQKRDARERVRLALRPELKTGPVVGLLELKKSSCRWPIGDPEQPGFGFCGCRKAEGVPYCARHAVQAYEPAQRRRGDKVA